MYYGELENSQLLSASSAIFFSATICERRVALSVAHPRGTHLRYVIGCCLIRLGICGLKNNSRRITYGIGCVWGMPSLSPSSSLASYCMIDRKTTFHRSRTLELINLSVFFQC